MDEEDKAASMLRHAHCGDLVIVSQSHPAVPAQQQWLKRHAVDTSGTLESMTVPVLMSH